MVLSFPTVPFNSILQRSSWTSTSPRASSSPYMISSWSPLLGKLPTMRVCFCLHQGSSDDLNFVRTESRIAHRNRSLPDSERLEGEHNFWNPTFWNSGGRKSRGLGGGDFPFSKHEAGIHAVARLKECVTKRRLIRRPQPRQPFERGSGSEKTPLLLV